MKRTFVAGFTALALIGPSLAYAQEQAAPQGSTEQQSWHPNPADLKAFTEARIAGLKAGLQLTADQEKKWPAVEQAIRDMAQSREERMTASRADGKDKDAITRLRTRADAMTQRATQIRKLADATEPLYQSLNDDQKRRLRFLVQMAMGGHHHGGGWGHRHGGWNG
jgi:zinc resistance-associated protein